MAVSIKLATLFVGVLVMRALPFGVYLGAHIGVLPPRRPKVQPKQQPPIQGMNPGHERSKSLNALVAQHLQDL